MGHARTDILLTAMKSQPVSMPACGRGASVAYVIDPRFPGGTSSAVAQELRVVSDLVKPRVFGISSGMFRGETVAPQLETALQELGLTLEWDPPKITADVVIVHNPAFLKFQNELPTRILAGRIFVVTHENLIRPTGAEAFDVASCLGLIGNSTLALERYIAPISPYNRSTIRNWFGKSAQSTDWKILPEDWFNICDFEMQSPTASPLDRRGRLSRPGFEKFPRLEDLELCFHPLRRATSCWERTA
ncbi:MAG: hypothetical protein ACE5FS_07330 [Paracoccaceae bacterium]